MEITQDMINRLLEQNDEELQKTFRSIAAALGMNEKIAVLGTSRFKAMLAASNPQEIERLLSSIDPARAQQILKTVNDKGAKQ